MAPPPVETLEFATFGHSPDAQARAFLKVVKPASADRESGIKVVVLPHFETGDALQKTAAQERKIPLVILYDAAEAGVARNLAEGISPPDAVLRWSETAQGLLRIYRKYRRKLLLIDSREALQNPAAFAAALGERLKLPLSITFDATPTGEDALYQVIAAQTVLQSVSASKLNRELAAGRLPVPGSPSGKANDVVQAFEIYQRQAAERGQALGAVQQNRDLISQMQEKQKALLEQLEKRSAEMLEVKKQLTEARKKQVTDAERKALKDVQQSRGVISQMREKQKALLEQLEKRSAEIHDLKIKCIEDGRKSWLKIKSLEIKLQAYSRMGSKPAPQAEKPKAGQNKSDSDPAELQRSALQIRQLQSEKALQQIQIKALQTEVETHYAQIMTLKDQNRELEHRLGEAGGGMAAIQARVSELDQQLDETKAALLDTRRQLAASEETLAAMGLQTGHLQEQLARREEELQQKTDELHQVLNSNAWKVTGPLRHAKDSLVKRTRREK